MSNAPSSPSNSSGPVPKPERAPERLPVIPGHRVERKLGEGGMGAVYKAVEITMNRVVAVKVVHASKYEDAASESLERFRREIKMLAMLDHAHIVKVYQSGEADGLPWFSMEYIKGEDLSERLKRPAKTPGDFKPQSESTVRYPQDPQWSASLLEKVSRALHTIHVQGLVHRDMKPANIMLDARGEPHVMDFGLAKEIGGEKSLTMSGQGGVVGSPFWMSPEQADESKRKLIGPCSDVWAMGVILYEMLTSSRPFQGSGGLDTLFQVSALDPVAPSKLRREVPKDLETICLKCLEKEPVKRYSSAEALAEDLKCFQDGMPIHARPATNLEKAVKWARRRPTAAGLAAFSVLALVLFIAGGLWFTERLNEQRIAALRAERRATEALKEQTRMRYEATLSVAEMDDEKGESDRVLSELDPFRQLPELANHPLNSKADALVLKARDGFKHSDEFRARLLARDPAVSLDLGHGLQLELVLIPAGTFMMGSPESEAGRVADERQHEVTLSKPFYMGKYPVTQEQYERVMGKKPSAFASNSKSPVETISWFDAKSFCGKLNKQSGRTALVFRLPTEAQWEYACRAGTTTRFYTGDKDSDLAEAAWYKDDSNRQTHAVGGKKPNGFGLYDMHGNVWQWCQDWYVADYYTTSPKIDPLGPEKGEDQFEGPARVVRGGSWYRDPHDCRSANREKYPPSLNSWRIGMRVVLPVE